MYSLAWPLVNMEKHIDIQKDVISFQQAIDLCVLGFKDITLCAYEIENQELYLCHLDEEGLYMPEKDLHAPFKSQAFRWFREKYQLEGILERSGLWLWFKFEIYELYKDCKLMRCAKLEFNTYEEAENACIDKLIELAKQQSNTNDTLSKQQDNDKI